MSVQTNHGHKIDRVNTYDAFAQAQNYKDFCNGFGRSNPYLAVTGDPHHMAGSQALTDANMYAVPIHIPAAATITGFVYFQVTQGSFTADSNNRIGLYKPDDSGYGSWKLVASSANNASLWKGTASTYVTEALSSTYAASAGTYLIVWMYNNSAQTTAPALGYSGTQQTPSYWTILNRFLPAGLGGLTQPKYGNNYPADLPGNLHRGLITNTVTNSAPFVSAVWWGLY